MTNRHYFRAADGATAQQLVFRAVRGGAYTAPAVATATTGLSMESASSALCRLRRRGLLVMHGGGNQVRWRVVKGAREPRDQRYAANRERVYDSEKQARGGRMRQMQRRSAPTLEQCWPMQQGVR